jgi:DNA gyrase subunit A
VRLITLESKEEGVVGMARVAETTPEAEAAGVREAPEGQAPVESAPEDGGGVAEEGEGDDGGEPEGSR